ncbi:MAG: hypothetical protein UR60_C0036G0008 [Candidatus Moranbacteria bacterium GW2011_GWF2_34_56]|nr:MAG: hypothetical protein UR60_C0036G0008 [Candidatus Moranbacteria bacterium GW2011_GWF2_34_56]
MKDGYLRNHFIIESFANVDRVNFVLPELEADRIWSDNFSANNSGDNA